MNIIFAKRRSVLLVAITAICNFATVSALSKFIHKDTARTLTDTGLGSRIHLLELVDNPFESMPNSKVLEGLPSRRDESLSQEPVPPEFRSRQSFGQFSLASSFSETTKPLVQKNREAMSEIDALNRMVGVPVSLPSSTGKFKNVVAKNALYETVHAYSGPSSVDFVGACSEGYVPFYRGTSDSLDDCWSQCRSNFACTQVHFNTLAQSCLLSHGISTRAFNADATNSTDTCRSLTPAGVATVSDGTGTVGLPPFELLPNNQVLLVYNGTNEFMAASLAECQSACLQLPTCSFGVWLLDSSTCNLGYDIIPVENSVCPSDCVAVCGTADCLMFVRNVNNLVSVPGLMAVPATQLIPTSASTKLMSNTVSCETVCGTLFGSEDPCLTFCLADKRAQCQGACASNDACIALAFQYGNQTEQFCTGFTDIPNKNVTSNSSVVLASPSLVEVYVGAPSALGSIPKLVLLENRLKAMRRKTSTLDPSDVRPKFSTFTGGSCSLFHEWSIFGTGPGLSRFSALSIDECWALCMGSADDPIGCSQVHFYANSNECVLGDSIAPDFMPNPSVVCRSLDYMPTQGYNGLVGMMFVDTVGRSPDGSSWFVGAADGVLVDSLAECQTLCKQVDDGQDVTDSACRYAGYVDCSSFHATLCQNSAQPDCGLCDQNPAGGVCRIPAIAQQGDAPAPLPCLGGQCQWFEKGGQGYMLQLKTVGNGGAVDFSGPLFCNAVSYLPASNAGNNATDCYYVAESLWHCQSMCDAVNQHNSSGQFNCVGGIYSDTSGTKQCRLAQFKVVQAAICSSDNCAWFELGGLGHTAGLDLTGMDVASKARELSMLPFILAKGACTQFKALEAVVTNTPSGFQVSPIEDCAHACAYFPQCMSFQVAGSVTGSSSAWGASSAPGTCDVTLPGHTSDCTFVTCTMSSALTLVAPPVPFGNNSTLCYSKTPSGTVDIGPGSIDMDGIDPGIPGFVVMNARVRKFSYADVINKNSLALVPTLEECQSLCRTSDACKTGTWQPCQTIEQYCPVLVADDGTAVPPPAGISAELLATCSVCQNVAISESQPSVQFPPNVGVCKLASAVGSFSEGCAPEPCYAFEAGLDDYFVLSMTQSPFLLPGGDVNGLVLSFQHVLQGFMKTISLAECQTYCDQDDNCKYGHFEPRTTGFGECYLSGTELRIFDGQTKQLKNPVPCEGICIVFMKLPSTLPPGFAR